MGSNAPYPTRLRQRVPAITLLATLVWTGAALALDQIGLQETPATAEAIVVLGCRVLPDGTPSPALAARATTAANLYLAGVAPRLVFTGGTSQGHRLSEARAAAELAYSLGVPPHVVTLEEASTSTWENALFAKRAVGPLDVVVVTDGYHVMRGRRVLARHFNVVGSAGSTGPLSQRLPGAYREVVAVLWYGLTGRL